MPLTVTLVIVTPKAVEFVIFICCCELLPTFTDPKFIEVGLTLTDDADAALPAKIKSNNSITAIGNAKEILFDMFRFCPLPEGGCGATKTYRGPWIFTTEGVYELLAESVYWSGGTREDRVGRCPLMYLP
ncbi:MAG TPA: hypothetical protein VN825_07465 [Candidatus Acidoferrum sp.]|nr:hypothetical protein [Candidatus Acidoferrum sp.]